MKSVFFIVCLLALSFTATGCKPAISNDTRFELRVAYYEPQDGAEEAVVTSSQATVYVAPEVLVTGPEVERVYMSTDERGRPNLNFKVNETAAKRLAEATKQHAGDLIAIVVDGKTLYALPIESEIGSNFVINGYFGDDDIQRVYSSVTGYF